MFEELTKDLLNVVNISQIVGILKSACFMVQNPSAGNNCLLISFDLSHM